MEQKSHGSPSFINIAVLLLFAVVIAVASTATTYYFLSSKTNEQPPITQPPVIPPAQTNLYPTTSPTIQTTVPADETANWKVYKNEKYGFKIKYPQDWAPYNLDGQLFRIAFVAKTKNCSSACASIEIFIVNSDNKSFQQIKKETENQNLVFFYTEAFPFKETTVDGKQAFIVPAYETRLGTVTVVYKNYMYSISRFAPPSYSETSEDVAMFDQILSTFKFIE